MSRITVTQLLFLVVGYFLLGVGATMTFGMLHPWGFVVMVFGALFGVYGGVIDDWRKRWKK